MHHLTNHCFRQDFMLDISLVRHAQFLYCLLHLVHANICSLRCALDLYPAPISHHSRRSAGCTSLTRRGKCFHLLRASHSNMSMNSEVFANHGLSLMKRELHCRRSLITSLKSGCAFLRRSTVGNSPRFDLRRLLDSQAPPVSVTCLPKRRLLGCSAPN
jgi:hypothetical protein